MTAIASGVGSLFGSGKLKELEQANGKLQGEIDKRDNQIRLLNDHMRMQEERHSTETHCQQEVHRQELNMKVKKIEELNEIIGKAFKWFPVHERNAANGEVLQVSWIYTGNDRRTFG